MKQFRRVISGFLAAVMVMTQPATAAYSADLPDAAVTSAASDLTEETTVMETSPEGEETSDTESTAPDSDTASGTSDTGDTSDTPDDDDTSGTLSENTETPETDNDDADDDTTEPAEESEEDEEGKDEEGEDKEQEPVSIFDIVELTSSPDYLDKVNKLYPFNDVLDSIIVEVPTEEFEKAKEELSQRTYSNVDRGSSYTFSSNYLYSKMTAADKAIYDQLRQDCEAVLVCNDDYDTQVNFTSGGSAMLIGYAPIGSMDFTRARAIVEFFRFSNPQYYFLSNTIGTGTDGSGNRQVSIYFYTVDGHDFSKAAQRQSAQSALDSLTNSWMPQINAAGGQLQRELKIIDLVADYITYDDWANNDSQTDSAAKARLTFDQSLISSVLNTDHLTVCAGYAMMTAYFCNAAGIDAFYVNSDGHAWNIVNLYNNYYELDLTWYDDDRGSTYYDDRWVNKSYATFLANDNYNPKAHAYKDHWSYTTLPSCTLDTVNPTNDVVRIEISVSPTNTQFVYGNDFDLSGGKFVAYHDNGESEEFDMAEELSNGALTVSGYNSVKLGDQTLTLSYGGKTATLDVKVIVDPENPPVVMDGENYLSIQDALNDITESGDYYITLNQDSSYSTLTIPAKANSVSFETKEGVILYVNTINANADFNIKGSVLAVSASQSGPDIRIAAGKTVTAGYPNNYNAISGAANTKFIVEVAEETETVSVNTISNVTYVGTWKGNLSVIGSISQITNLNGSIILDRITTSVSARSIDVYASIKLRAAENNGVLSIASLTVDNLPTGDDSWFEIEVIDAEDERIAVPSGTKLLSTTAAGSFRSDKIDIKNKTTADDSGNDLTAFKYGTEIRAEYADAIWLTVRKNGEDVSNAPYPNLEAALDNIVPGCDNYLTIGTDLVTKKFDISKMSSLGGIVMLQCNDDVENNYTVTFKGSFTSLSAPCNIYFKNIRLAFENAAGTEISAVTLTGTGNIGLENVKIEGNTAFNITNNCSIAGAFVRLGNIYTNINNVTGKNTIDFFTTGATLNNLTTFRNVTVEGSGNLRVVGNMSGIKNFSGNVNLDKTTSKATVENITGDSVAYLRASENNGVYTISSLTVKDIADGKKLAVAVVDADDDYEPIALPSGTNLFKASNASVNFTDKVQIYNKTPDTKDLDAFLYGTDIRAEISGKIELCVSEPGESELKFWRSYPNIDLALKDVQKDCNNSIILKADTVLNTANLPRNLGSGSLEILSPYGDSGPEETFVLDLNGGNTINAVVNFQLANVKLRSLGRYNNPVASISISSTKKLTAFDLQLADENANTKVGFSVGSVDSYLGLGSIGFVIDSITGYNRNGWFQAHSPLTVNNITNIGGVSTETEGVVVIKGKVSSVDQLCDKIVIENSADVSVNALAGADITILADTTDGIKLPKLTSNYVNFYSEEKPDTTITIKDSNGTVIALPDSTKIFNMTCPETTFYGEGYSSHIKITNKNTDGNVLNAFYYYSSGREVRVEYAGTISFSADGGSEQNYPNLDLAFKAVKQNAQNTITLNDDIDAQTFVLPTNLGTTGSLEINGGDHTLTLHNITNLVPKYHLSFSNITLVPLDRTGSAQVTAFAINGTKGVTLDKVVCSNPTVVNVTVGAGGELCLSDNTCRFGTLTGTATSVLKVESAEVTAASVRTFSAILLRAPLTVTGTISGVVRLSSDISDNKLILETTSSATITTLGSASENAYIDLIAETDDNGNITKLPTLTATYIDNQVNIAVWKLSDDSPLVLPAGTKIFTMTCSDTVFYPNNYSGLIKVAGNDELYAYLYSRDVKLQSANALTLKTSVDNNVITEQNYPNFELAFKAVKQNVDNKITLNEDIDAPTFVLPTNLGATGSLDINGGGNKLTLHNITALAPRYDFSFNDMTIVPLDRSGNAQVTTFAVNGTKSVNLIRVVCSSPTVVNVTVGAGGVLWLLNNSCEFGNLTGTATSLLSIDGVSEEAKNVSTFNMVWLKFPFTVTGTMSRVNELFTSDSGSFILPEKSSATVTTLGDAPYGADIVLIDDAATGIKLPTLNVTNIAADSTAKITVKSTPDGDAIALPSGTQIFTLSCGEKKFTDENVSSLINIVNQTSLTDGKPLTAYLYGTALKAEYSTALTLTTDDGFNQNYPNFEKAFAAVQSGTHNTIYINEDIDVPYGKFTLPTNLGTGGSLEINGKGNKLMLNGITSLSPRYTLMFVDLNLVINDRNGKPNVTAFTISGSSSVQLTRVNCSADISVSVGAKSELLLEDNSVNFVNLSGTATSTLIVSGAHTTERITTFGVVQIDSNLVVSTSMAGVTYLGTKESGELVLKDTAAATITNLGIADNAVNTIPDAQYDNYRSANIMFIDDAAEGIKIAKLTVTNIVTNAKIAVRDSTGHNEIALKSGTPIFTFNGGEAKFDGTKITIVNKTTLDELNAKPLTAYCYGSNVKAEYSDAIKLTTDGNAEYYPSFVKMFSYISGEVRSRTEHSYTVTLNENCTADAFALPTSYTTEFILDGNNKTLTLGTGVTSISAASPFTIKDITLDIKGRSLNITGSKNMMFRNIKAENVKPNVTANGTDTEISGLIGFGTVTGRNTLYVTGTSEADSVTSFKNVNTGIDAELVINKNITAAELAGNVVLKDIAATANFTTVLTGSEIHLEKGVDARGNSKISALTIGKAAHATGDIGTERVTIAIYEGIELSEIASGTSIFRYNVSNADIADLFSIRNKTTNNDDTAKPLTPFVYGTDVRAEYADMLTLKTVVDENVSTTHNYPNFELAFRAVKQNVDNKITLNEDIDAPTFVLPTNLGATGSLEINGGHTLTLHNITTLAPRYGFIIQDVNLVPLDRNGTAQVPALTINASRYLYIESTTIDAATTVNTSINAGGTIELNGNNINFGNISGTATSTLTVDGAPEEAKNVTTFGKAELKHRLTVTGNMSGVNVLETIGEDAQLVLPEKSAATITTLGTAENGAKIVLIDDAAAGMKLPTLNVTNIADSAVAEITVKSTPDGGAIALPSGTQLFTLRCGEAKFNSSQITIVNETSLTDGKPLTAYLYGTTLKAEYSDALTLSYDNFTDNFPNFELAFKAAKQGASNMITMNEDIDAQTFVLPTNLGNNAILNIVGGGHTLTLHNLTALAPRYEFTLTNVVLVPLDRNGTAQVTAFAFNGTKTLMLNNVKVSESVTVNASINAGGKLVLWNNDMKIGSLTGTATSTLETADGTVTADRVTTFGKVSLKAPLEVNVTMTGVNVLETSGEDAQLILPEKSAATVTTLGSEANGANIVLIDDEADGIKLPTFTVTNAANTAKITVKDAGGNEIPLPSGTKILNTGSAADISAKISILNKDSNNGDLTAVTYGREIRAEVPDAVWLVLGGETTKYTSFEKLFEYINTVSRTDRTNQNEYVVTIYSNLETKTFTLPTYGAKFTVKSADGKNYDLVLKGVTISPKNYPVNFENVNVSVVRA
ncbi:MAG: bacterial Ig-like domain-containing protein [Ruminiclostridium sp.]|nr:bacterial Ig-like domain-containing protein [Ruminiclostridium sp.]